MTTYEPESTLLSRLRRWLPGPSAGVTCFVLAQPVLLVIWTWVLYCGIPATEAFFASEPYVADVAIFYLSLSSVVVILCPLALIDLLGGFLFGVYVGLPLALATKTSGSTLCFLLSRRTCSSYLHRNLVERYEWLGALSLMVREKPFQTMLLVRLSAIPAAVKNYGCGSLGISVSLFATVTALSLSLESLLLVPMGKSANSWQEIVERKRSMEEKCLFVVGVIILLGLALAIRRTVRSKIERLRRHVEDCDTSSLEAQSEEDELEGVDSKEATSVVRIRELDSADSPAEETRRILHGRMY